MTRNWWAKFLLLVVCTVLGVVYVFPTVANLDLKTTKFPFKQKINLGLDLQGGVYMVMGADFNKVFKDVIGRQAASVEGRTKEKGIEIQGTTLIDGPSADDPRFLVRFDPSKRDTVYNLVKQDYSYNLRLAGEKTGELELGLSHEFRGDVRDRTINQSIDVIRNRIDEFGVTEPSITSQGNDRILIELPGINDVEHAKDLIGRTAKLEFKIVDDEKLTPPQLVELISTIDKEHNLDPKVGLFSKYVQQVNEFAKGKIPAGDEIAFEREGGPGGGQGKPQQATYLPFLLHAEAPVTGEDLQDASVGLDPQDGSPKVNFTFNPKGASIFEKVTEANIKHRLAIVLDSIVQSAPVINDRIGAHGQITLGRGQDQDDVMKEAKDLAIVLRAGALPAQLDFLEQRVIGPSLGADSIHKGALASLVGSLAVFLFVIFYYRVSGVIAVFSLILNVLFVLACLVGLEATLTLPGIAGIALTVGIAVDSNVVIYERIREELRAGKNIHGAVESGFQKAFRTILDANVTNAVAACVLLIYGTGPIKGFAVSLLIGIVTTLFTAVFVCKVVFDAYLRHVENRGGKTLSI